MKRFAAFTVSALMLAAIPASAQNEVGKDTRGAGNGIGDKESYATKDPSRTGASGNSQTIPGKRGAGASVGEKEGYSTQDPARTGPSAAPTNPKASGSVGDTGTGK